MVGLLSVLGLMGGGASECGGASGGVGLPGVGTSEGAGTSG